VKAPIQSLIALLALLYGGLAHAVLTIEISGGTEGAMPIAIVPFAQQGGGPVPPVDIASVIAADLKRSGRFTTLPRANLVSRPASLEQANLRDWRLLGSEALVMGTIKMLSHRRAQVKFELVDVPRGKLLKSRLIDLDVKQMRRVAHHIADIIYEALTGVRGAFNTRIAYITASPPRGRAQLYELKITDSDGLDDQRILTSKEPILSPTWSPDGHRLAYVSFETGRPEVWIHDITTGKRRAIAKWKGLNSAPAWSPDGGRLALSLSRDGNPEIYILNLADNRLTRVTHSRAIDTEPAWMPNGRELIFTSDRGGKPQLYRIAISGGRPTRITFNGNYNAGASVSPDGRHIAMVHRENGAYRIAVMDLGNKSLRVLTSTRMDESPSFSPNGSVILYATETSGGRGILSAITIDKRAPHRLSRSNNSIRDPAWRPFIR